MTKFYKIKKKSYFCVIFDQILYFLPKGNFGLENPAKYNCSDPPVFKCQRYRVNWRQTKNYSITISTKKPFNQSTQFPKPFARCTRLKSPMIYKALPTFSHAHPRNIKLDLSFAKFVSTCKKSAHFINSFLRYSRF